MATTTATTTDPTVLHSKRVVYVSGLAEGVTVALLRAAMIPFGPIHSIDIPMDYVEGKHRGFAFCEFEDADDANEAIFNKHGSELLGKIIQCNVAQANQVSKLSATGNAVASSSEAIWKSDEWFQQQQQQQDKDDANNKDDKDDVAVLKTNSIIHQP